MFCKHEKQYPKINWKRTLGHRQDNMGVIKCLIATRHVQLRKQPSKLNIWAKGRNVCICL
jgi:hypothetical protein